MNSLNFLTTNNENTRCCETLSSLLQLSELGATNGGIVIPAMSRHGIAAAVVS